MDIEDLTIRQVQQLQGVLGGAQKTHSFKEGKSYLIRCVTHFQLGKIEQVTDTDIILSDASWVADTGRFSEALKTGNLKENEPFFGDCIVARGAIVDAVEWPHNLLGTSVI